MSIEWYGGVDTLDALFHASFTRNSINHGAHPFHFDIVERKNTNPKLYKAYCTLFSVIVYNVLILDKVCRLVHLNRIKSIQQNKRRRTVGNRLLY